MIIGKPLTWEQKCKLWGVDPDKSVDEILKELAERERIERREWYRTTGHKDVWLEGDHVCVHKTKVSNVLGMDDAFAFDRTKNAYLMDRARYQHMTTVLKGFPTLNELEEWKELN